MKALIVGANANIYNTVSMVNGFKNIDFEPGYFGYRSFIRKYGINLFKKRLLEIIDYNKPDWIFFQYQYNSIIPPDFFKTIRKIAYNSKISLMSVDMRNNLDENTIKSGKFVDVCFQKGRINYYKNKGLNCKVLQEGYSDLLFFKQQNLKKEIDIVFAGSFYPKSNFPGTNERVSIISYLSKFYNIKVIGSGWDKILGKKNYIGYFQLENINELYNKSKIVLNINHYNDIEHYWSIRMIEGMASGSLMLTKYIPGLENYFSNHKDIVWFYSLADCMELLKFYLENNEEREKIINKSLESVSLYKWENVIKEAYSKLF